MSGQLPSAFIPALKQALGKTPILTDPVDCLPYGSDDSHRQALPDAVVFVEQHEQVLAVVRLCNEYQIPLVARGAGTGTCGGAVPIHGGVVISFERMNRILKMDPANRVMVVEPGVTNQAVQQAAAEHGFFWPPDPGSAATCMIGGNLAFNSAGPRAVKYGTPRENTLGLRAITGDGRELRTGVYTTKGVVGYDLTRLLIGSEGTLALVTEATLKLTPLPESIVTLQVIYRDIQSAITAVSRIMAQPVTPYVLEFIDKKSIELMRTYSSYILPNDAGALLIIEVDGLKSAMEQAITVMTEAAKNEGLLRILTARDEQERQSLWQARRALSPALRTVAPKKINEDVVVPVSHIPDFIMAVEALAQRDAITIVNFGHAGNGNVHVNLLIDPEDVQQAERAQKCLSEIFDLVLSLNGTLSGEHGVGTEKQLFISRELDPVALNLMRQLKSVFDPCNILNPGKIFPD